MYLSVLNKHTLVAVSLLINTGGTTDLPSEKNQEYSSEV